MGKVDWSKFFGKPGNNLTLTVVNFDAYVRTSPFQQYHPHFWLNRAHVSGVDDPVQIVGGSNLRFELIQGSRKANVELYHPRVVMGIELRYTTQFACSRMNIFNISGIPPKRPFIAVVRRHTVGAQVVDIPISPIYAWPPTGPDFSLFSCTAGP